MLTAFASAIRTPDLRAKLSFTSADSKNVLTSIRLFCDGLAILRSTSFIAA